MNTLRGLWSVLRCLVGWHRWIVWGSPRLRRECAECARFQAFNINTMQWEDLD